MNPRKGTPHMNTMLLKAYIKLQDLATREEGQDIVEYFLVTSLMAFSWIAGTKSAAGAMNHAFQSISTSLSSYVS
jgi:Flp pilus assembly pilin Flp